MFSVHFYLLALVLAVSSQIQKTDYPRNSSVFGVDTQAYYKKVETLFSFEQKRILEDNYINTNEQISPEHNSQSIQNESTSHPLRMTVSFSQLQDNNNNQKSTQTKYAERVFAVAFKYFSELINIKETSNTNNKFFFKELDNCLGDIIRIEDYEIGVKDSDLHLFASFTQRDTSSEPLNINEQEKQISQPSTSQSNTEVENDNLTQGSLSTEPLASAGLCYVDPILKRPTFGRIILSGHHFLGDKTRKNLQFKKDVEIIIHEIIHVLGFSPVAISYWIDSDTGETIGNNNLDKILKQHKIGERYTYVLKSKNVLTRTRKHFGCSSIVGMQLEDEGSDLTASQHWEHTALMAELMTGAAAGLQESAYLSTFTIGLLKDTGFWGDIRESMGEEIYWGRNKGCEFFENLCASEVKYAEFENKEDYIACTFNGRGYGLSQIDPLSNNCPIVYQTTSCPSTVFDINQGNNHISLNRCVQWSKRDNNYEGNQQFHSFSPSCHQITCKKVINNEDKDNRQSNLELHITLTEEYSDIPSDDKTEIPHLIGKINNSKRERILLGTGVCLNQGQMVEIFNSQNQVIGKALCPGDFAAYCQENISECLNDCSQRGFCLKGICHCIDNFSGIDCSDIISKEPKCESYLFLNPDNTCRIDCPVGYFKDNQKMVCEQCLFECLECTNIHSCTVCNHSTLLNQGKCVEDCSVGMYSDTIVCQPCMEGCLECTYSLTCLICDQSNGYTLFGNTCFQPMQCFLPCTSCIDSTSPLKCKVCMQGYFLQEELCVSECSEQYYLQQSNCFQCDELCLACEGSPTNCTKCTDQYKLKDNRCVPRCTEGQIFLGGKCREQFEISTSTNFSKYLTLNVCSMIMGLIILIA